MSKKSSDQGYMLLGIFLMGALLTGATSLFFAFYYFMQDIAVAASISLIAAAITFVGGITALDKLSR